MSDDSLLALATDFPPASHDRWRTLVDGVLAKGMKAPTPDDLAQRYERDLVSRTYDGIEIDPLYDGGGQSPSDRSGFPGLAPFVRGRTVLGTAAEGWDICQRVEVSDDGTDAGPSAVRELEGGATSVWLGLRGAPSISLDALDRALDGVYLDLIPIRLDAGDRGIQAARALMELWDRRGIPAHTARASLGLDPFTQAAVSVRPLEETRSQLVDAAEMAAQSRSSYPQVRTLVVNGNPYHQAGASDADELGCSLAVGAAYLRTLTDAGLAIDEALAQIECQVVATADQFLTMAKMRAARRLWSRVGQAVGASPEHSVPVQHAVTSSAMLSAYDPWVNLLRATVAGFASAAGGADVITILPFDWAAVGPSSSDLGRRLARNIHALLLEEANVARVIDPAGGSWYVEALTDDLARAAWKCFQEIEGHGGMLRSLLDGFVHDRLAATWKSRADRIATGADPITGVSEFPNIDEPAPNVPITEPAEQSSRRTLSARRYSSIFEHQRARADRHHGRLGVRPSIFLANLGPPSVYTARATFAKNLFEVAGIAALTANQSVTPDDAGTLFSASGATVACLCSSDSVYADTAVDTARALKAAGAQRVYLAGRPGDRRAEWEAAGIDEYVYQGVDRVDLLTRALDVIGVP